MTSEKHENTCNLCGCSCTLAVDSQSPDFNGGLIDADVVGGYHSTPGNGCGALDDGTRYRFNLCEFCLDWLFSHFTVPVKMYDYTSGGNSVEWRCAERRVVEDDWRRYKDEFVREKIRRDVARKID